MTSPQRRFSGEAPEARGPEAPQRGALGRPRGPIGGPGRRAGAWSRGPRAGPRRVFGPSSQRELSRTVGVTDWGGGGVVFFEGTHVFGVGLEATIFVGWLKGNERENQNLGGPL